VARVDHHLPTAIKMPHGALVTPDRPGVVVSERGLPVRGATDWGAPVLRSYQFEPILLKYPAEAAVEEWDAFLRRTSNGSLPFWLKEPLSDTHPRLHCGPLGDGSRTSFPLPCQSASNVVVFLDTIPQPTSGYTLHSAANLLTDAEAECGDWTLWGSILVAFANPSFGLSGLSCLKVIPVGGGNPIAYLNRRVTGFSPGDEATGIFAVLNTGASRNYRAEIRWYTAGDGFISMSMGSWTTIATTDGWVVISVTDTAPATAAKARVSVQANSTATDPFYADCAGLARGDYDRWHLPSMAPGLIEFGTAPASRERVSAYAEGYRVTRVRIRSNDDLAAKVMTSGRTQLPRLTLDEDPEY